MTGMASHPNFGAPCTKSIKISSENPNFFEAYDLYSHTKMRNALNLKMHTTPTQVQEYMYSHERLL